MTRIPASQPSRRDLARWTGAGLLAQVTVGLPGAHAAQAPPSGTVVTNARIRQSVCKWCYPRQSLAELAAAGKEMGLESIELVDPKDFPILLDQGLGCAMVNTHPLTRGLAQPDEHEYCIARVLASIDAAAEAGFPSVITFSGLRKGMEDEQGMLNSVAALGKILPRAEAKGINVCMELLNSKVDHPGYMCDRTAWGFELVEKVGSERFKLLYDIYHMQIMEGDVIRTVTENLDKIGHFHTGGVPGRHELDETQELFYPAIIRAIVDGGYQGFLGQEFIPTGDDPIASLRSAVALCDV